ncbi:MAG: Ig-like domain-containing protein [Nitrososphaerota archaeon]
MLSSRCRVSRLVYGVFFIAVLLLTLASLSPTAGAQPPQWSLQAYFLPLGEQGGIGEPRWLDNYGDRYFPGEVGNLTFQLVNTDCSSRAKGPHVRTFTQMWEDELQPIFERLEAMNRTGYILDYLVEDSNAIVYGDRKLADWEVTVVGYCVGQPIQVESAKVWYAWPGYGETLSSTITLQKRLEAVDPIKYIFEGENSGAILLFTLQFSFPPDLPSQLFETQPTISLTLRYPSGFVYEYRYGPLGRESEWWLWGLRGAAYGPFRLSPYRTFSIRITDNEGALTLGGAKLFLKAHVYTYTVTLTADSEGVVQVNRLPDFYSYSVSIAYAPPLVGEDITVYLSSHDAIDLASARMIRTDLYTFRIYPVDQNGKPLLNATVLLQMVEEPQTGRTAWVQNQSSGGYASFYLLPTGNYSITIFWRGVEVFSSPRYIGYHPTLGFSPLSFEAETTVSDLIVSAVDMAGNPVGAVFEVEGPTPETSFSNLARIDGVLVIPQQPLATYLVSALNESATFNSRVSASSLVKPGEPVKISLPIYSVSLRILSMDERPVPDAEITFHTLVFRSDTYGGLTIPGVPKGAYDLVVRHHDVTVFSGEARIEGNTVLDIHVQVYDLDLTLLDSDGSPIVVEWSLSGPGGNYSGVGSRLYTTLLPEALHRLTVYFREAGKLIQVLEEEILPSELRDTSLALPISTAKLRVVWSDGEPFNGTLVLDSERYPIIGGIPRVGKLVHRTLNISLETTGGVELLTQEVQHTGKEIQISIPQTYITVIVQDVFLRPVEGAKVLIYSLRRPGLLAASGNTGSDGKASFTKLPEALAPYRVEVTYGDERFEVYAQAGVLRFSLNSMVVWGTAIPATLIVGAFAVVTALALVAAIIGRVRARIAERQAGEE